MSTFLAVAGPIGWATLMVRAWRQRRRWEALMADTTRLHDKAQQHQRDARKRLARANAELAYVRMLRRHNERQASTRSADNYRGNCAPV